MLEQRKKESLSLTYHMKLSKKIMSSDLSFSLLLRESYTSQQTVLIYRVYIPDKITSRYPTQGQTT